MMIETIVKIRGVSGSFMGYRCKICEAHVYNDRALEGDLRHNAECLEAARIHIENLQKGSGGLDK